jgi:hypothetical protein
MAEKCIEILIVVMIEFYVLIVVKIQANNHASNSFAYSAPIMLPHFFEFDKIEKPGHQEPEAKQEHQEQEPKLEHQKLEPKPILHSCITKKFEDCEERLKNQNHGLSFVHSDRLFSAFKDCLDSIEHSTVIESCIHDCRQRKVKDVLPFERVINILAYERCFETCYETHVKNHPDKNNP